VEVCRQIIFRYCRTEEVMKLDFMLDRGRMKSLNMWYDDYGGVGVSVAIMLFRWLVRQAAAGLSYQCQ
jgi:hypothetical protein